MATIFIKYLIQYKGRAVAKITTIQTMETTNQLGEWLEKVNKSKLDDTEKCRIYYSVLEEFAKRKKYEYEDIKKSDKE